MKKASWLSAGMVGCLVLAAASCAFAQDWPQWRGPARDGKVTGFEAPAVWPKQLTEKWRTTVGTGDATPALLGDNLYVFARQGEDEVTLCLHADTGKEIWKDAYAAQAVSGAASRHPGPRSSPAVAGGKVVTIGVGGVLSCLDAAKGKLVWRKDPFPKVVPRFFTAMSPMIVGTTAIAHLGGQGEGAMLALDLATGEEKWRWTAEAPEYASPVLMTVDGTEQIVTLSEKSLLGISLADGKLLWQVSFVPKGRAYNAATPIIDRQTVIFTGSGRGTRAVKIEKQSDGFAARELWSNPEVATQFNTPVLKDGLLFGLTDRSNLFCLRAATGEIAWTDDTRYERGFAAMVDAGTVLLVLPSSSELIAFKPSEEKYEEVARVKVADSPTYAHPLIAGNRIFIKDADAVTMWTIP